MSDKQKMTDEELKEKFGEVAEELLKIVDMPDDKDKEHLPMAKSEAHELLRQMKAKEITDFMDVAPRHSQINKLMTFGPRPEEEIEECRGVAMATVEGWVNNMKYQGRSPSEIFWEYGTQKGQPSYGQMAYVAYVLRENNPTRTGGQDERAD